MSKNYPIMSEYKQRLMERILTEEVPKVVAQIKAYEQDREPLQLFRLEFKRFNSKGIQTESDSRICDEDDVKTRVTEARYCKATVKLIDDRIVSITKTFPSGSYVTLTYTPITE